MFTPFSAKNAQVRINGNTFTAKKWSVEFDGGNLDVTNFEGGGFSDAIGGVKDITVTIDFDWDSSANMLQAPLSLTPGSVGSNLNLYFNGTINGSNAAWNLPSFLVLPLSNNAAVKESVNGSVKIKNKGAFTGPSITF